MQCSKGKWLPHLNENALKGWYGAMSAFSIALEAWRRGLSVSVSDRICSIYSISLPDTYPGKHEKKTLHFKTARLVNENTDEADRICKNKDTTKEWLSKKGIAHPKGKRFNQGSYDDEIIKYATSLGFPVVLKPTKGSKGKGVVTNIQDELSLQKELAYIRQKLSYKDIIVEEYVTGNEYRVLVVGEEAVGVISRVPANVVGNGKNTISELIQHKNKIRKENPSIANSLIKMDQQLIHYINQQGFRLASVPLDGEWVSLRKVSNISQGGDPIDVTDDISETVKKNAIDAVRSVPGLCHAGVDVLINDTNDESEAGVILEMNARPMISLHLFPVQGIARDIARAIIDHYFPETMGYNTLRQNDNLYIDVSAIDSIVTGMVSEITLKKLSLANKQMEIVLSGTVQGVGFRRWAKKEAVKLNLMGYAENLKSGQLRVVVAGDKDDLKRFMDLCKKGPSKALVEDISIKESNRIIHLGFQIKET